MEKIEFSYSREGALFRFLRKRSGWGRIRLNIKSRVLVIIAMTWLPLLLLTNVEGFAFEGKVQIPFLYDLIQHARFLIALPLAIIAEAYVGPRMEAVLNRFIKAGLIVGSDLPHFYSLVDRAKKLKDSLIVELVFLLLAYLYMSFGLQRSLPQGLSSWDHVEGGLAQTSAEFWYQWVSMPIFLFVWIRWVWRHLVWANLLFNISRMNLALLSTHPDQAGGLVFVSVGQRRFAVLLFAISAIASASIGEEILFGGASLYSFEFELISFFLICVLFVMCPLFAFTLPMIRAKLRDWSQYGLLAAAVTRVFDDKWIRDKRPVSEEALASQDFQSLADLKNSYDIISKMRTVLPDRTTIFILLVAYLIPLIPLMITVIPTHQILSELFKLLAK